MLGRLINKREFNDKKREYKSWYDLSSDEACKLECEFASYDMGKVALRAMHICVTLGIITFVICAFILEFLIMSNLIDIYSFVIMILFILFGSIIVVCATIEYHSKFNSWLEVKYNIIKK